MAKIRYLNLFDIFSLNKLVSHLYSEKFFNCTKEVFLYPLSVINYFLPISAKFFSDSYVAEQNGKLSGMISIKSRKNNHYKWKIKKLLLDENSYETGEQLINYVVAKYGAHGVETIGVDIDSNEKDMIDLFSKACGFRYCLDYQFYLIKTSYYKNRIINSENCIYRPFKPSDSKELADLFNKNISPYYKFPLSKIPVEFCEPFFKGLNNKSLFKFILEDKFSKQIRGYLQIETENNKNFVLEIVLLPSFEYYFEDMITFAISQIVKRTNNFELYFKNNRFHEKSKEYEKYLSEIDNELTKTNMIFVKDFFKQIKDGERVSTPAMIYNELSGKPVCKI